MRCRNEEWIVGERVTTEVSACLVLSCPSEDLASAAMVISRHGLALLPAGGEGDLGRAAGIQQIYIVEIDVGGPRSAATWCADLGVSVPLVSPDPADMLPPSWVTRHPDAYSRSREVNDAHHSDGPTEAELWDDDDEPSPVQVFVPVTNLRTLPRSEWVFTNELVRKQLRGGRRFAPRVPTLVTLPEEV